MILEYDHLNKLYFIIFVVIESRTKKIKNQKSKLNMLRKNPSSFLQKKTKLMISDDLSMRHESFSYESCFE